MKNRILVLLVAFIFMVILFHPGCKSGDECDFSILGTWNITITVPDFGGYTWTEILTFTGSAESGVVSGWAYEAGHNGTYTVTNCSVVEFIFDYISSSYGYTHVVFNGTLVSASSMSGSGTWYDDDWGMTSNLTWNGVKF
jgi:hypothetical protein